MSGRLWLSNFSPLAAIRRIVELLEFVLAFVAGAVIVILVLAFMLGYLVLFVGAIIDAMFLGRFGVSVIGGLAIVWGIDLILCKRCPDWYQRNLVFEGHNTYAMLAWMGIGHAIWSLKRGISGMVVPIKRALRSGGSGG